MFSLTKHSFISLSVVLGSLCVMLVSLLCKKLPTHGITPLYDQPRVIERAVRKENSIVYFAETYQDLTGRKFVVKTKLFKD